jgi:hypothetical protein
MPLLLCVVLRCLCSSDEVPFDTWIVSFRASNRGNAKLKKMLDSDALDIVF